MYASRTIDVVGWDGPHANYLGYTYVSQFQNVGGKQYYNAGGGAYFSSGPYVSVVQFPELGNFLAGTMISLEGWV